MNNESSDKMSKMEVFLFTVMITSIFIIGFLSHILYTLVGPRDLSFNIGSKSSNDTIQECADEDLDSVARCLRDVMYGFYDYKITEDLPRSEKDIRENGGDCYDYANLYVKWAKQLGLNAKTDTIVISEYGHRYAIIWNEDLTQYCTLDQTMEPSCHSLGVADED